MLLKALKQFSLRRFSLSGVIDFSTSLSVEYSDSLIFIQQSFQSSEFIFGRLQLSDKKIGMAPAPKDSKKRIEDGPAPLGHNENRLLATISL